MILHYDECVCGSVKFDSQEFCFRCLLDLPERYKHLKYWRDGLGNNGHPIPEWQREKKRAEKWLGENGFVPRQDPLTQAYYETLGGEVS